MNPTLINRRAAFWWGNRFKVDDFTVAFEAALEALLPDGDWVTDVDYDPCKILRAAILSCGLPCEGMFSARPYLPFRTTLKRQGDKLFARRGRGAPWEEIR